jgi:V/A-type H+-transporting ATPase subunit K
MVLIATIALITTNNFVKEAYAQEAQAGLKFVGAGLAFGLAALGAGVAIGGVGAAGLAVISERPDLRSQALVFTALGEAVAIYGIGFLFYLLLL